MDAPAPKVDRYIPIFLAGFLASAAIVGSVFSAASLLPVIAIRAGVPTVEVAEIAESVIGLIGGVVAAFTLGRNSEVVGQRKKNNLQR